MRRKPIIFLILPVLVVSASIAVGQDAAGSIEQLNAKILELQQQIMEMRKRHEAEIKALEAQIKELADASIKRRAKEEIESLRELAKAEAAKEAVPEEKPEETVFKSASLGLQALNPEISVTGDFLFSSRQDTTSDKSSDFEFRTLGVHVESWLDPYTRFKAAIPVTESETKLGEGYITLYDVADDLNLTLGKFRQQFGVVNRWHKHGLDQVDFPLALRQIFGNGGLN